MTRLVATPAILVLLGVVVAGLSAGCGSNQAAISQPDASAAAGAGGNAPMGGSGVLAVGGVNSGGVAATGGSFAGSPGAGGSIASGGAILGGAPSGGALAGGAGAVADGGGGASGGTAGSVVDGGAADAGGSDVRDAPGADEGGAAVDGAQGDAVRPAPGQRILFEVAASDFAMAVISEGIYITSDGGVYKWVTGSVPRPVPTDGGTLPVLGRADQMTEAQVTAKYGASPELIATVPAAELLDMFALVGDARAGALLTQSNCADAGEDQFVAWLYDSSTSTYTPVLLGVDGDTAIRNVSPAANKLVTWLFSLQMPLGQRFCQWSQSQYSCTGATCGAGAPVCSGTQVPVVVGGCWGTCVSTIYCSEVSSCSDCRAGLACITDADGKHHCVSLACSNQACGAPYSCSTDRTKEVTCDCAADQICAGGRAWCRGSFAEGFSCAAP